MLASTSAGTGVTRGLSALPDDNPSSNTDPVAKATRSPEAARKAGQRRTGQHEPCHTIDSLFDELENRTRNTIRVGGTEATFPKLSTPTERKARARAINERVPSSRSHEPDKPQRAKSRKPREIARIFSRNFG